jgi:hypothetical protein
MSKRTYKILWDNGSACDTFSVVFTSKRAAARYAAEWKREMVAIETTPEARRDAREAYSWEIIEHEPAESDDSEETCAAEEQSLDYFNRYIAGDR